MIKEEVKFRGWKSEPEGKGKFKGVLVTQAGSG